MAGNSIGQLFRVTTFGESHGLALGCIVDGVPPGIELTEADLQHDLDRRRPGTSRYTTQRREPDQVKILSGVFEGRTTGTSIGLLIENTDQRSQDYGAIKDVFRPGHAKVLNATSNVGGLLLFIIGGKVIWATGFVMMVGQFLGARAGSRLVLSKGQKLIRPMIVVVSAVMSAKLLYDSHGQEILHWLGMN